MKKYFKLYWPILVTTIFLFVYGILIGTMIFGDAIFENDFIGIMMVLLALVLVIGIYAEMIYFMIKASKNKDIKNKILWCLALYFFHIFIFPYFNLKYVCNEKKNLFRMIIFVILSLVVTFFGIFIAFNVDKNYSKKTVFIIEDGVKVNFSGKFRETEIGEYDFYLKDEKRQINIGGFIYDEDDNEQPSHILSIRDSWVKVTRSPATLLDTYKEETDDSIINTNIYVGTNEGIKNIYYISTIEFKDKECFVNTLSIYLYDENIDYKDEIKKILIDMEYVG